MTERIIKAKNVPEGIYNYKICLMNQEIKDTTVNFYSLEENSQIKFSSCEDYIRILLLCSGEISIESPNHMLIVKERAVFIDSPTKSFTIRAARPSQILELHRWISKSEFENVCSNTIDFPFLQLYNEAPQYTEDCKSEKAISRMLVPQRLIPRFAMGSVETNGEDLITPHTHPMLDQYFFSFADNECIVLIDDLKFDFHRNTLLHIPLGSIHGVILEKNQTAHYVWMDFFEDAKGISYMDQTHKMKR